MALNKNLGWDRLRADKRAKQMVMGKARRAQTNPRELGKTQTQIERDAQHAAQSGAALGQAAATGLAQQGMASGWSGQMAETARQMGGEGRKTYADALAKGRQESEAISRQYVREAEADLRRAQDQARESRQRVGRTLGDATKFTVGTLMANPKSVGNIVKAFRKNK